MNIDNIKSLAQILTTHGLSSLEVDEAGTKIRLKKEVQATASREAPIMPESQPVTPTAATETTSGEQAVDFNRLIEVKSPLVGVFYSAASPESEPFVSIGTKVKKGDVLCIIETMKLMNEVQAEQDGEIVDVCMKNGEIAEFGQVLYKMY